MWTPIDTTPPVNTAVELSFDDGSSDLAMWIGTQWLPDVRDRHPSKWRQLPIRLPLFDELSVPGASVDRVA